MDHETALQGVMDTVAAIGANPSLSEDELVRRLQGQGHSRVDAEKLNVFVPSAFSWVVLKRLGVAELPNHFIALDQAGREARIPVGGQHQFTAALALAQSTFENGWSQAMPRSAFEAVAERSAEMNAANQALDQGGSLEGASLQPLRLLRLAAEDFAEGPHEG